MNHKIHTHLILLNTLLCVFLILAGVRPVQAYSDPTVLADRPDVYTLQKGEFPYCIARRYNVDPEQLLSINHLNRGQIFYPGLVLSIPEDIRPFPGERALRPHKAYTIQAGDTIGEIACLYGDVEPSAILSANGLADASYLPVGKTLIIPDRDANINPVIEEAQATLAPTVAIETLPEPTSPPLPTLAPTESATLAPTVTILEPPTATPSGGTSETTPVFTTEPEALATPKPNVFQAIGQMLQDAWRSVFKKPEASQIVQPTEKTIPTQAPSRTLSPTKTPMPSNTPAPTKTPMPSNTPAPTEIPVLEIDPKNLNYTLPQDIKEELTLAGTGGGPEDICYETPQFPAAYSDIKGDNSNYLDILLQIKGCGFDPGDVITAKLYYPNGKVETQVAEVIPPYTDSDGYRQVFEFYVALDEPEGTYHYVLSASGGRTSEGSINLSKPSGPHIRLLPGETNIGPHLSDETIIGHYILYGFVPYENVRILAYQKIYNVQQGTSLKMLGWQSVQVDDKGRLKMSVYIQAFTDNYFGSQVRDSDSVFLFAVGDQSGEATSYTLDRFHTRTTIKRD